MRSAGTPREIKIAYVGGGSKGWAQVLMKDLALAADLTGELRLYDIDHAAALRNASLARRVFAHRASRSTFAARAVKTPAAALKGADFVVMSIEPGPIEMRYADLEIPRKAGIIQPVGDSTGPGGIMRALRAVPVYADYARRIMALCPQAWVINYTNPMTICTSSLYAAEPGIKAFGCCHEVFGTQSRLARLVAARWKVPLPARHDIKVNVSGVNHFTMVSRATWQGRDIFPLIEAEVGRRGFWAGRAAAARKRSEKGQWFSCDGKVAYDFFRRFGALGAAGDRHLVEFVPWYLQSEAELHRWGVVLTPYSWRLWRARKFRPAFSAAGPLGSSGEEGVSQMQAILGSGPFVTNVNLPNRGQAPDLPLGAVVESYAEFSQDRVTPLVCQPLPAVAAALQRRVIDVQRTTLAAAMQRDKHLAFQALLADPLVHIPTDKAWAMFKDMLEHTRSMLKGWRI